MPGAAFEAAVKQSRELKEKPTDDELLKVGWKHPIYVKILGGWSEKGLPTSIQLL
jgi:acyl-CoA-binding protein